MPGLAPIRNRPSGRLNAAWSAIRPPMLWPASVNGVAGVSARRYAVMASKLGVRSAAWPWPGRSGVKRAVA